jgi:aminodeoxyfutalosine synthase
MTEFDNIREKILHGERISDKEALFLFESPRLFEIGQLADIANYRKNKDSVFYNMNSHLNPTNVCVMSCKFCSFARKPGEEGAFAYSLEEILEKAEKAVKNGAKELHMVGGLHPKWNLEYYAQMFRSIKERHPHIHIKGMTAVEIDWLARKSRKEHADVLLYLKEAGLDSLPGGGAEIFHPDCRDSITAKLTTEKWVYIHRMAHNMGLKTNCTILYGHVETYAHRVYHLNILRTLQDDTGGFNCFIPLAFQPYHNEMGIERYTFGADDLKMIAIARLYLDNFQQVKSYWVMLGQDIAQLALHFGANDMDGTVVDEKISIMAGGRAGVGMERKSIKRLIMKARKKPIERDTLYNILETGPEFDDKAKISCVELLRKAIDGDLLSAEELRTLAEHADLSSLAITAQKIRNQIRPYNQASFRIAQDLDCTLFHKFVSKESSAYNLDLAGVLHSKTEHSIDQILKQIALVHEHETDLVLCGFSGIWKLVQQCSSTLSQTFKQLYDHGVRIYSSSSRENESGLTHREIVRLHQSAHENGLLTLAKIEINSPPSELTPLWKTYIERILALRALQENTNGIRALSVEPATDSWVTAQEYVRAVALARIACPNIEHIQVSIVQLPTSREMHLGTEGGQSYLRGQEKYAPLLLLSGADDFGSIPNHKNRLTRIYEEICSVGMRPCLRDSRFAYLDTILEDHLEKSIDLRHVPLHEMTQDIEPIVYSGLAWDNARGVENNAAYH